MNLNIAIPDGISPEGVVFSLPYNVSRWSGRKADTRGQVLVTEEKIQIYEKNKLVTEYGIRDFLEYEVVMHIGCSVFRGRYPNGTWESFATFSQSQFLRFTELAKILDFYINTGDFIISTDAPEPNCEKCGASLGGETTCIYCQKKGLVFLKLFKRILPFKKYFFISLAASLLLYSLDVIVPILQRLMIDELIVPMNLDWDLFKTISLCIVSIGVVDMGFFYLLYFVNTKMSSAFGRNLRADIFSKTQFLSTSAVNRRTSGELINRISSDVQIIQDFVTREGKDMIFQVISLICLSVIMFLTNWRLALIVVIPLPIAFYISTKLYGFMDLHYGQMWRFQCQAADLLHDVIQGIRVIKNYGSENREIAAYNKASKKWADSITNADKVWYMVFNPLRYLFSIGEFAALYFGASLVLADGIKLGELVQFMAYVYMLYGPIQWLVRLPRVLAQTSVSAAKVFEILDEETDVNDSENAVSLDIKGDISFEKVYFGYKSYNPVLKDVSCNIKAGEMIGIVGHSGVGKSTFINLILRLYDTTGGHIKIDNVDIKDIEQNSLRSQVGVVLQETFLFNGSVYENIRYAKPDASFEEIIESAKIANCHDFIVRLPDGYNTIVGERGYNLSGGERQRVAIARAILHNPKIIILDEATASLDTQTEKQIQEALGRLTKGRTTIAIAHRLSTLSNADRLIVLDKGKVAEIGTHNELMASGGVYFGLVMAQRQTARIRKAQ